MPAPKRPSKAQQHFMQKAPGIMRKLMRDFPKLQVDDAAATLGNLGHECAGFTKLQEIAPTMKGSRGGYDWPMWTGPRRRARLRPMAISLLYIAGDKLDDAETGLAALTRQAA